MPISIISPEFAFLNFNGIPTEVCDESIFYPLPVYGNLAIKSQVQIESDLLIPIEDKFYVGICSTESCCNTYRFKVSDNSFDICNPDTWNQGALNITDSEGLVNISNGYYQPNTLWQTLSTIFDTEITGCEFTSCKSLPLPFRFLVGNQGTGCFVYLEKITNNATVIYDNNIELTPVCKKYKWQTYFEGDTIPTSNPYHICNLNTIDSSNLFINGNFDENANGWDLTNLYWLDGKLLSVQSNSEEVINVVVTQTLNLNISKYYRLKFNYTNNLLSNVGYVRVADTANNEIYLTTFTYDENNNSTEFSCIFSVPNDGNYHIYIGYQAIPVFVFTLDNIILEEVINITSSNDSIGYTPIPTGYYTREELYVVLEEIIGIPFSCEFSSCCLQPKIEFTHTFPDDDTEFVYSLLDYWDFAQIVFPNIEMDGIVEVGECFKYCILDKNKNVIACSNIFKRIEEDCLSTLVEYWNNENAYGFKYPSDTVTNLIRLPFFPYGADYPTTEKIYKETGGNYRRLSTVIEKEYDVEVDKLPEWLHDMIIVALKHDNVLFTSNRIRLVNQPISQQGNYTPDWKNATDFQAKAKFKFRKKFNGSNSNCKSQNTCS